MERYKVLVVSQIYVPMIAMGRKSLRQTRTHSLTQTNKHAPAQMLSAPLGLAGASDPEAMQSSYK